MKSKMKGVITLLSVGFVFLLLVIATEWKGLPFSDIMLLLRIYGVAALVAGGFFGVQQGMNILVIGLILSAVLAFLVTLITPEILIPASSANVTGLR